MSIEMTDRIQALHQKLTACLNTVKLGIAGRLIYYDEEANIFILAMHSTSPEKTQEAANKTWDSIPEDLKAELYMANIGFAGKQI